MTDEKYSIITIGREYGSGGTSIAKKISERLNIPWYDRDFAKITAKESGYSYDEVLSEGEEISDFSSALNTFLNNAAAYTSSFDEIFKAQKEALISLPRPCIVIGRCGNLICREAGIKSFDIFLYSDIESRVNRIKEITNDGSVDVKYVSGVDHKRENYYKKYTHHELGDYKDYDMCLNTGVLGYDKSADIIVDILEGKINPA